MNRFGVPFVLFSAVLGLIVVAADAGVGARYWGWLGGVPLGDKLGHLGLMFAFCLLANLALAVRRVPGRPGLLVGTAIVSVLVITEECSQRWIPGRSFDLLDLAADALGILFGDLLSRVSAPALWPERSVQPQSD
jgi:hypothetical protein